MVSSRRDTSFQHLTDADLSACVDSFLVNVLPVFIEERQPVEQLGMFDLGHIPKQRLVEVMVGVDKTRHHQHARTLMVRSAGVSRTGAPVPMAVMMLSSTTTYASLSSCRRASPVIRKAMSVISVLMCSLR